MKIKSIKFTNHKILGNLSLDFTDESSKIVDTIIFAGENGTGKSTILNLLHQFSSYNYNFQSIGSATTIIAVTVELSEEEISVLKSEQGLSQIRNTGLLTNEMSFTLNPSYGSYFSQIRAFWKDASNTDQQTHGGDFTAEGARKIFKSIFLDVEINFSPGQIDSVTAKQIDLDWQGGQRSTINLAKEITQLLVDIQTQDATEFADSAKENNGVGDPELLYLRMKRFNKAFGSMFPGKHLKRIATENSQKKVLFEENKKEIPIDSLSSGEKQIVFRGSFLLKDQNKNADSTILIDEPEISLHPRWQLKILNFYKKLFTNDNGEQTSQIFVATHSPFIIHNETRQNDKIIVLERDEKGEIVVSPHEKFFGWTSEETIKKAFSIDWGIDTKPLVLVEGDCDICYLQKAAELLGEGVLLAQIELKDGGGKGRLGNKWKYPHFADSVKNKIILLFDCETNQLKEEKENLYKRTIPFIDKNPLKKGIENLFSQETIDKAIKEKPAFIDIISETEVRKRGKIQKQPTIYEINNDEKRNLCNWLCENGKEKDFENFKRIFEIIREVITA